MQNISLIYFSREHFTYYCILKGKCYPEFICHFICLLDDTESLITTANTMIKNANNITTNVLSELDPIKAGIENIKNTYENVQITDFNKALREASNSGSFFLFTWIP